MNRYSRTQLSDDALLHQLKQSFARDRSSTALLLADIAEVDARKLYLPAGYSSMYAYCIEGFNLTKDAASKRIQAARIAREIPGIFEALADGRLNLSGVSLLAPHLNRENADELLSAAAGKSKFEIEAVIARRFPRSESLAMVETLPPRTFEHAPGQVGGDQHAPGHVRKTVQEAAPISAQRFTLRFTFSKRAYDSLSRAQELLGHQIPSGDLAQVLERLIDLGVQQLEKRKFAATDRPGHAPAGVSSDPRYIPRHVKRAAWKRDNGQCTFVSVGGHRCTARKQLEFDHVQPVARGGQATVDGIRLRCRAHNQFAAECAFGKDFMDSKREAARTAAAERERANEAQSLAKERTAEVVAYLEALGIRARDAQKAVERSGIHSDAPLEERVRAALSCFGPRRVTWGGVASASA